ncbi:hypothetical protein SAMN04488115_10878 [Bosea lathyri]|uniref:Uncharacterized protein n=2 Tax=Bosea lathyri TaxID=1036778 RepID=A0A1H6BU98_9HYPH|nr:hypothetical protein SAMN04488115_10878 [Bosea lathyri]
MSYVLFKKHVLEAFDGENVTVEVTRREGCWGVYVKGFDGELGAYDTTTAVKSPNREAVRAFCLGLYKSMLESFQEAENERAESRA